MGLLRLHISQLEDRGGGGAVVLERVLAESTIYTESVADAGDLDTIEFNRNLTSKTLEGSDGFACEATRTRRVLDWVRQVAEVHPTQIEERPIPPPTQQPLFAAPAQMLVPDSDHSFPSPPDMLVTGLPLQAPNGKSPSGKTDKKSIEPKPLPKLDHEAMRSASMTRRRLSRSERRRLDNRLLLRLEGNQGNWVAVPGDKPYQLSTIGSLSTVRAVLDDGADPNA